MSLMSKILSLLAGVTGAPDRVGVASSILYICDLFLDGNISEDQARTEIYSICYTVIKSTYPDLLDDEVRKKSNRMVEEIIRSAKLLGMRRRMFSKFRSATRRRGSSILPL